MRLRRGVTAFLIFVFFLNPLHVYAGHIFESQPVEDGAGDTFNFEKCFNEGVLEPQPMELDIRGVEAVASEASDGSGGVEIALEVTLNMPPLPHMSYTIELGLDVDGDPTTGSSQPTAFYGGLGVDYDVGVEVLTGVVASTWVDRYDAGSWVKLGETTCEVTDNKVRIGLPLSLIPHPLDASGIVFLIQDGGLDIAPGVVVRFHYMPEARLSEVPSLDEGSEYTLDASGSSTRYGGFTVYDWDLDGDGVFDESGSDPTLGVLFQRDGDYRVTVRVTDAEGFTASDTQTVTVLNLPPTGLEAGYMGEAKVGNTLAFTASATDPGGDPLTYEWSFGDDATAHGAEATHDYAGAGFYIVMVTVTDDAGAEATTVFNVEVAPATTEPTGNGGGAGVPPMDPLLIILIIVFGFLGVFIYNMIRGKKKDEKAKPPEKPKEPGDYCKEHPEVVEAEKKACDDAQWDLDQALGPIEEKLDKYRQQWRNMGREIGRLLMEWDTAYAVIQSLTKSEKAIKADSEKVQKIAGIVKPSGSMAKTAFKKGGEEAMKELGKHVAQEVSKGIAGEVSSTVSDLLGLEDWATREIGIGIAKLITGIDPKKEASDMRKKSMEICTQLQSWVDSNLARTTRFTSTTLQSCIADAEGLKADIDKALKDFEDKVAGFKCVKCKVDPGIMEHIDQMQRELDGFIKAFGDLIDQIQQRLSQAAVMYSRKDVYDSPYVWAHEVNNYVPGIKKTLRSLKK
jgi:hypothetical protein